MLRRVPRLRALGGVLLARLPARYANRVRTLVERWIYSRTPQIHDLPPAFHYWSNRYLRPQLEALGYSSPDDFFFRRLSALGNRSIRVLSLGSGRCESELALAQRLRDDAGVHAQFVCTDINPTLLRDAAAAAAARQVTAQFEFVVCPAADVLRLGRFDAVLANQCLHHFVDLEAVFAAVRAALVDDGVFLLSDVIGRNGHQLWPEALDELQKLWAELPAWARTDAHTGQVWACYDNRDYSALAFEGIRAQDILPLLLANFHPSVFIPFGGLVIVLLERRFGRGYMLEQVEHTALIHRIAQRDAELLASGAIKPTQLIAEWVRKPVAKVQASVPLPIERWVRWP